MGESLASGARELFPGGPSIGRVALGTSPLGGMPDVYGYDVDRDRAVATVREALRVGLDMIDTSNEYGHGESERRIGEALETSPNRAQIAIATKADPAPGDTDFSRERVLRSFEESVTRLGVEYVDVFYLHDPERFEFAQVVAPGGPLDAALELKAAGRVGAVGVAGGDVDLLRRYVETGKLQIVLNHNRYNLLDRTADALVDHANSAGVAFVNAAPYASGILARGPIPGARFQYQQPDNRVIETVERLQKVAESYEVPLAALALQFSTRDPRIASTVVGASSPDRARSIVANLELEVPKTLWESVEEILG